MGAALPASAVFVVVSRLSIRRLSPPFIPTSTAAAIRAAAERLVRSVRDDVGVVRERDVAVRAQADLQVVVAEGGEDRIVRIRVLAAARRGGELGRQLDR